MYVAHKLMSISQGPAISRFEYVNCKEALKPTFRRDQIIEKDRADSQTKLFSFACGTLHSYMQIFLFVNRYVI